MFAALARPKRGASVDWSPVDERWYREIGGMRSDTGALVVPEAALSIAVVFRAVNVLAHSVAGIPLVIYRRLPDEGKERARDHAAYDLLHDKPNSWQTSFRWRHLAIVQSILHGNHYSEIRPGPGGIGALAPLDPDATRVVDQLRDGRLLYVTRGETGERRLLQDYVFHLRGFSLDGKSGIPLPRLARNAMGLALSAEKHGSMFMRRGARHAGFLSTDGVMNEEVRKANEANWARTYSGADASGSVPILTGGMKFASVSSNNKDSQWLEARTFQVEELLRFLGVPGVLCGYADKTSTYASAEQFFLSFVTHTVRPLVENFAAELNNSVVVDSPEYFADFLLEGLLRGDIKTRYDAHRLAIASGWKTRNEVRREESYNRGPDALDEFLEPLNMVVAGEEREQPSPPRSVPAEDDGEDEDEGAEARLQLAAITRRTVERLVRKETAAIAGSAGRMGAAARYAGNEAGWREWLTTFYEGHADLVAADLGVSPAAAARYCARQRERFDSLHGADEDAERNSIAALMRLTPIREG